MPETLYSETLQTVQRILQGQGRAWYRTSLSRNCAASMPQHSSTNGRLDARSLRCHMRGHTTHAYVIMIVPGNASSCLSLQTVCVTVKS